MFLLSKLICEERLLSNSMLALKAISKQTYLSSRSVIKFLMYLLLKLGLGLVYP